MSRRRRNAALARTAVLGVLAFVLVWSTAVALAYRPAMHHDEDCPMPLENRGAPTALSAPAMPPPAVAPLQDAELTEFSVPALSDQYRPSGVAERVRVRDPPVTHL